jgi:hypothetical protein
MDGFICEKDWEVGKVLKYMKPNPVGEDAYLMPDGTVTLDETKIIKAQRIFLHNYYKPDGPWARNMIEKKVSCDAQPSHHDPTTHL